MLSLDFNLTTIEERTAYVNNLTSTYNAEGFQFKNEELELMANYILYGKEEGGKSPIQKHDILTTSTVWGPKNSESLEGLLELPGFGETHFKPLTAPIQYKIPKPNLKRDRIIKQGLEQEFTPLWDEIDRTKEVLDKHKSGEEVLPLRKAQQLHHQLVELRREQYTLKDIYLPLVQCHSGQAVWRGGEKEESLVGSAQGYDVLPLGVWFKGNKYFEDPTNKDLPDYKGEPGAYSFDFREEAHVYQLVGLWGELETEAYGDPESVLKPLLDTLEYYSEKANLTKQQKYILEAKKMKQTNEETARQLKELMGVNYAPSYISTIWIHQICPKIAKAAREHEEMYRKRKEGKGAFKRCNTCGEKLPATPEFFVRLSRAPDGLTNRCKRCDKKDREKKKVTKIEREKAYLG